MSKKVDGNLAIKQGKPKLINIIVKNL